LPSSMSVFLFGEEEEEKRDGDEEEDEAEVDVEVEEEVEEEEEMTWLGLWRSRVVNWNMIPRSQRMHTVYLVFDLRGGWKVN